MMTTWNQSYLIQGGRGSPRRAESLSRDPPTKTLYPPTREVGRSERLRQSVMLSGTIVRGTPAGPYTTARRLAGRTRPEIKQVHRLSESPEQIAAVDREVAARAAP